MPRTKLTSVVTAVLVALGGATLTAVSAAPASALVCTRSWTGMVSNDWDNKDNWSPNTSAPTVADVACIAGGTPSLDSGNNHVVGSIILGGIGNPTLKVAETNNVNLFIQDELYVEAGATLQVGGPDTHGTAIGPNFGGATPTLTNNGTITFDRPLTNGDPWLTPPNALTINGVNNGTITLRSGRLDLPQQFTNNGTYTSAANTLTWSGSGTGAFFDNAGTVNNGGIFHFPNSTWKQRGATTGNPIVLRNQALLDDISGPAKFELWSVHLKGTINAAQTIRLGTGDGGAQITLDAPTTIAAGAKVTANLDGNGYQILGSALTNAGTLEIFGLPNSNGFRFLAPFVNAPGGTVSLKTGRVDILDTFVNAGTLATAADTTTWKSGVGKAFTQTGSIVNDGTFFVSQTTWDQQGGSLGGANRLIFRDQAVINDSGGTGTLQIWNARLNGTVPAGQTLAIGDDGGGQLVVDTPSSIASGGSLIALNSATFSDVSGQTLTNHGLIDVSSKAGEYRILRALLPLVNAPDGTIAVHSGRLDTYQDGLVNHGLLTVDPDAQVGVQYAQGKLVNAPDGTLSFGIAAPDRHGVILGFGAGRVVPGGTLTGQLVGAYDPPIGTGFKVIQAAPDTGTFAAVGNGWGAEYAADHIVLRRAAATPPPPPPAEPTPPTPTPPTPTPAVKHGTSLGASAPAKVDRGAKAKIRAVLKDATLHQPLKGHKVVLWRKSGKKWVKVAKATTDKHGRASVKVVVAKATTFRWTFAGDDGLEAVTSARVKVKVRSH